MTAQDDSEAAAELVAWLSTENGYHVERYEIPSLESHLTRVYSPSRLTVWCDDQSGNPLDITLTGTGAGWHSGPHASRSIPLSTALDAILPDAHAPRLSLADQIMILRENLGAVEQALNDPRRALWELAQP